jgi:predicted NAD-dependent protein-ADP-ribosyltransferase YbiA (DUF1768 family)
MAINIYAGSNNWIEATLSNLAETPFILEDEFIASVEGFHQGIKYNDLSRRRQVFSLWGVKAKSAGREANRIASGFVYWGEGENSREIIWQSKEYYDLYFDALFAKFTKNPKAESALLATGNASFSHLIPKIGGFDEAAFQKTHMCQSLFGIREYLMDKTLDISKIKAECSRNYE